MDLPGIGAPIVQDSGLPTEGRTGTWNYYALPVTVRERVIMAVTATIKDKPAWGRKVFDEAVVVKWKSEALARDDITQSQSQSRSLEQSNGSASSTDEQAQQTERKDADPPSRQRVITEALFQYCIEELRDQAADSQGNGFTEVMDANAAVYISDSTISQRIKAAIQKGVASLEAVPEFQKDWHPGSDGKVLDLVHPSLFPLMYGISKFLPEGKVPIESCVDYTGLGETVHTVDISAYTWAPYEYSLKYQWLPCDITIDANGDASIKSYINNLHPERHRELYAAIEQVITKAIPLWKMAVRSTLYRYECPRLIVEGDGYDHDAAELVEERRRELWAGRRRGQSEDIRHDAESEDDDEDETAECYKRKYIQVPDPGPYEHRERRATDDDASTFDNTFSGNEFQVIVKLANIHLTPDKPNYDGGTWHVEGLPNEHICASALYYYDSSNVTDSYLAFRESVNENFLSRNEDSDYDFPAGPSYDQNRYDGLLEIYGIDAEAEDITGADQVLGRVLTREDRLLVFPNVLQHRVSPFTLSDATKPGHRKLLALFLVDPNIRISSTANIPPQQRDWWGQQIDRNGALDKLPQELRDRVYDAVPEFPISLKRAKHAREELIEERKAQLAETVETWANNYYSFCEH